MKRCHCLVLAVVPLLAACGNHPTKNAPAEVRSAPGTGCPAAAATASASSAVDIYPVDSLITLRGRLVVAHEVRSFIPEGDSTEYWIIDRSGALERAYDRATGGQKNGTPAKAELKLRYRGYSDEGFAAEYAGVFEVVGIRSLERIE